jgi:threonine dehydrogenase-like Zn-dependent dehydrogenase
MVEKARAAVLVAPRRVAIEEFPLPKTGDDDALLRVEACGVCASDVPVYTGQSTSSMYSLPAILGHEIVGRVERLGQRAAERWGVQEGDRIIIERWIPCGRCERCYRGFYRLCIRRVEGHLLFYGGSPTVLPPALWGGYAEYVYLHPDTVVYRAGTDVPPEHLPLFTPISNAISWVQKVGGATIGSTVVILGPGQEGMADVIVAKEAGASLVILVGLPADAHRLEVARALGATHTIVAGEEDVVARVTEITGGRLADVVLDVTSGASNQPLEQALDLAGFGGTIVVAAGHRGPMNLASDKLQRKLLTIKGVWGRDRASVFAALRLIESGKYPLDRLTTHAFPLEEADLALRTVAREGDKNALHVSVVPGHGDARTIRSA